jgi:arabinan endo-1,5-alpha-L-arabinosidase
VEEDGVLFVFGTDAGAPPSPPLLRLRSSRDGGASWSTGGYIFAGVPPWALALVPRATNLWAPDASLVAGRWCVYYAVSSFGSPVSAIGLVTSPSLGAPVWTDRGLVLQSVASFNAIDPSLVEDTAVSPPAFWLVFGSFWSGIKMVRIDAATGLVDAGNASVVALAQRGAPDAIEGAFLVVRPDAHYLFVSWDYCCRGVQSNYSVRVGRSMRGIQGPYFDRSGVPMLDGGGSPLLAGAHGWAAGGGQSFLRSTMSRNVSTMVLHAYDGVSGDPFMQLVSIAWGVDGWPAVLEEPAGTHAAAGTRA